MELLRDTVHDSDFAFLAPDRRAAATAAVERGIECIIKCQVVIDGERTVWCAQHDAQTFAPVQARSYELPTLSGAESAGILKFLMSVERPSADVVLAVHAGASWFESTISQSLVADRAALAHYRNSLSVRIFATN